MTYILDGHKLPWHIDRVQAWERGDRIAPVTLDMALSVKCNFSCQFCAAKYQTGAKTSIPQDKALQVIQDAARIGIRGIALMSDGESTLSKAYVPVIKEGVRLGVSMANASNGYLLTPDVAEQVLPYLTYLRINFGAGEPHRYAQIMGVSEKAYDRVVENIRYMVALKRAAKLSVTINMNMVCHPDNADQILPFARLGRDLGVDYAIIKHCLDYDNGPLHVDYSTYERIKPLIQEAEAMSTKDYLVTAKWKYLEAGLTPSCERCYGPAFLLQISGSGLLGACGPLFAPKYADKFHIGNVCETSLYDLWQSDRYREVMDYLRSDEFVQTRPCRKYLCVQRNVNEALDRHLKGERIQPATTEVQHRNFI